MSKHTPGPWIAEEVGMSSAGDDAVPVYDVNAGMYIGVCEYAREADARLIAASPDMLEALQALMDPATNEDGEWYREARAKARAAIAKATGGAA